jgi:hypothetical protein
MVSQLTGCTSSGSSQRLRSLKRRKTAGRPGDPGKKGFLQKVTRVFHIKSLFEKDITKVKVSKIVYISHKETLFIVMLLSKCYSITDSNQYIYIQEFNFYFYFSENMMEEKTATAKIKPFGSSVELLDTMNSYATWRTEVNSFAISKGCFEMLTSEEAYDKKYKPVEEKQPIAFDAKATVTVNGKDELVYYRPVWVLLTY